MADILIDAPDGIVERLKKRAAVNGRELYDELFSLAMSSIRSDAVERLLLRKPSIAGQSSLDKTRKER